MALTKANGAVTQRTTAGNTDAVDISDAYAAVFSVIHATGSGTITAGGIVQPEISHDGTNFFPDGGAFQFGTTPSSTGYRTYVPPASGLPVKAVRFAWTVPVGSSGHTLNVSHTRTTGV